MPSTYAHHRFGQLSLPKLPKEVQRTIGRFRPLFDAGLHGPDLFFYYQPLFHTKIGELGHTYHKNTGRQFFQTSARLLQENPSEGAESYLYGVLGHFALDSLCHPMIVKESKTGQIGHTELEVEFDRHLLVKDGIADPHLQDLTAHLHLTRGESASISQFYPPATPHSIRACMRNMTIVHKALTIRNRELLQQLLHFGGKSAQQMVMYSRPNHRCAQFIAPLETLFSQALERYPAMTAQLQALLHENVPLGTDFDIDFG